MAGGLILGDAENAGQLPNAQLRGTAVLQAAVDQCGPKLQGVRSVGAAKYVIVTSIPLTLVVRPRRPVEL